MKKRNITLALLLLIIFPSVLAVSFRPRADIDMQSFNITNTTKYCFADGTCMTSASSGSGGNASWNESYANGKFYRVSNGSLDNGSWNETRANLLYSNLSLSSVAANLGNLSSFLFLSPDGSLLLARNATVVNLSVNFSQSNYTVACSISGNSTNKTAQCSRNGMSNFSFSWPDFDSNDTTSVAALLIAVADLQTANVTANTRLTNLQTANTSTNSSIASLQTNASGQQTAIVDLQTANVSLNSSVGTLSTNASVQQAQINSMLNLTYAQIMTSIGNWSLDKAALPNLTLAQIVTNIGNWSFDKSTLSFRLGISSGNNTNVSNGTLVNITNGSGIALVQVGNGPINITITNTGVLSETDPKTSGNGNWSADKGALPNLTLSQIVTNIGNYTGNATGWSVCGSGNFSRWNGSGFNCEVDQSGSGGSGGGWVNTSTLIRTVVNTTNVTALNTTGSLPLFFLDGTNGRVGIGTQTPAKKLDVVGDVNVTGNVTVGVGAMVFNISTDAANNTFLGVLQNISLGAIVPNHKLHINGTLGVEGAVNFKNTLCSSGTVLSADGTTGLLSCLNLNLGNWSADKGALPNLTLAQVAANIGNFTLNASGWQIAGSGNGSRWNGSTFVSYVDQTGAGGSGPWTNDTQQVYLLNNASNVTVGLNTFFVDNKKNLTGVNTVIPSDALTVNGSIRLIDGMVRFTNLSDGTVNASVTVINVTNATSYPQVGTVLIDLEAMSYTGVNGTVLSGVTRGVWGTTAAAHAAGANVIPYLLSVSQNSSSVALAVTSNGSVGIGTAVIPGNDSLVVVGMANITGWHFEGNKIIPNGSTDSAVWARGIGIGTTGGTNYLMTNGDMKLAVGCAVFTANGTSCNGGFTMLSSNRNIYMGTSGATPTDRLSVDGNLSVLRNMYAWQNLSVNDSANISKSLSIGNGSNPVGILTYPGQIVINGTLNATGNVTVGTIGGASGDILCRRADKSIGVCTVAVVGVACTCV